MLVTKHGKVITLKKQFNELNSCVIGLLLPIVVKCFISVNPNLIQLGWRALNGA